MSPGLPAALTTPSRSLGALHPSSPPPPGPRSALAGGFPSICQLPRKARSLSRQFLLRRSLSGLQAPNPMTPALFPIPQHQQLNPPAAPSSRPWPNVSTGSQPRALRSMGVGGGGVPSAPTPPAPLAPRLPQLLSARTPAAFTPQRPRPPPSPQASAPPGRKQKCLRGDQSPPELDDASLSQPHLAPWPR